MHMSNDMYTAANLVSLLRQNIHVHAGGFEACEGKRSSW